MNSGSFGFIVISEGFPDFLVGVPSVAEKLKLIGLDPNLKTIMFVNAHELKVKLGFELDIDKALKNIFEFYKQIGQFLLIFEFFESFFKRFVMVFVDHVEIEILFENLFEFNDVGIGEFFYDRVELAILVNFGLVLGMEEVLHVSQFAFFCPPKRIFALLAWIKHFYHDWLFIFVCFAIYLIEV